MLNFANVIKCLIMDIALNSTDNYWNLLKHLSSDVKLELIARLSRSLQNDKADSKSENVSASSFYGVWISNCGCLRKAYFRGQIHYALMYHFRHILYHY